jgi:RNA polymerase sigma factor (sigma-70 family)
MSRRGAIKRKKLRINVLEDCFRWDSVYTWVLAPRMKSGFCRMGTSTHNVSGNLLKDLRLWLVQYAMASPASTKEDLLPTRNSLLSRLKDMDDGDSWSDFFQQYRRLVYQVARQSGLSHHESEEVVQETVIAVSKHIPNFRYNPEVCSFKTWLMNLTRWRIVDQLRKRGNAADVQSVVVDQGTSTDALGRIADPMTLCIDGVWDNEWKQHVFNTAQQRVKAKVSPEQYQIFHLYTAQEWPVRKIVSELGVSTASVYLAKHRVSALIRREVRHLEKRLD